MAKEVKKGKKVKKEKRYNVNGRVVTVTEESGNIVVIRNAGKGLKEIFNSEKEGSGKFESFWSEFKELNKGKTFKEMK